MGSYITEKKNNWKNKTKTQRKRESDLQSCLEELDRRIFDSTNAGSINDLFNEKKKIDCILRAKRERLNAAFQNLLDRMRWETYEISL